MASWRDADAASRRRISRPVARSPRARRRRAVRIRRRSSASGSSGTRWRSCSAAPRSPRSCSRSSCAIGWGSCAGRTGRVLPNGVILAVHWVAFFAAIQVSTVAIGLLGYASFPLFVPLLERAMLGIPVRRARARRVALVVAPGSCCSCPSSRGRATPCAGSRGASLSGFTFALLTVRTRKLCAGALVVGNGALAERGRRAVRAAGRGVAGRHGRRRRRPPRSARCCCSASSARRSRTRSTRRASRACRPRPWPSCAALEPVYGIALALLLLARFRTRARSQGPCSLVVAAIVASRRAHAGDTVLVMGIRLRRPPARHTRCRRRRARRRGVLVRGASRKGVPCAADDAGIVALRDAVAVAVARALAAPRVVWLDLPTGFATELAIQDVWPELRAGRRDRRRGRRHLADGQRRAASLASAAFTSSTAACATAVPAGCHAGRQCGGRAHRRAAGADRGGKGVYRALRSRRRGPLRAHGERRRRARGAARVRRGRGAAARQARIRPRRGAPSRTCCAPVRGANGWPAESRRGGAAHAAARPAMASSTKRSRCARRHRYYRWRRCSNSARCRRTAPPVRRASRIRAAPGRRRGRQGRHDVILVLMGVCGCGKTTVGEALAAALGWPFSTPTISTPQANVAKMAAGEPLTDDDRWPWLDRIAAEMRGVLARGDHAMLACSALKSGVPRAAPARGRRAHRLPRGRRGDDRRAPGVAPAQVHAPDAPAVAVRRARGAGRRAPRRHPAAGRRAGRASSATRSRCRHGAP